MRGFGLEYPSIIQTFWAPIAWAKFRTASQMTKLPRPQPILITSEALAVQTSTISVGLVEKLRLVVSGVLDRQRVGKSESKSSVLSEQFMAIYRKVSLTTLRGISNGCQRSLPMVNRISRWQDPAS